MTLVWKSLENIHQIPSLTLLFIALLQTYITVTLTLEEMIIHMEYSKSTPYVYANFI